MISDLRAMALYVTVVDTGSFSEAAKALHLSPSVISHHIAQLENKYDVALLYRSTRKLTQTAAGQSFYNHAHAMVQAAQSGLNVLSERADTLKGELRVSLPASLIRSEYTLKISQFMQHHPDVRLNISYSDKRQDLIGDGIDLAIRVGLLPDSSLMTRKLGDIHRKTVCTPAFLEKQGLVQHPKDLRKWQWLKMTMMPATRTFIHPIEGRLEIETSAQIEVDSVDAMYQLCLTGAGISTPPDFMVTQDLIDGNLIEILPDWSPSPMQVQAVWPANIMKDNLTMTFLHFLTE